jgi:hypothetical protein
MARERRPQRGASFPHGTIKQPCTEIGDAREQRGCAHCGIVCVGQ